MDEQIARVRALTGITPEQISDEDLAVLITTAGDVLCAAADAADRMAVSMIGTSGITSVEDITVDRRRPMQAWVDLAARLRARCVEEARDGGGMSVVEFAPYGGSGIEAVESWRI